MPTIQMPTDSECQYQYCTSRFEVRQKKLMMSSG